MLWTHSVEFAYFQSLISSGLRTYLPCQLSTLLLRHISNSNELVQAIQLVVPPVAFEVMSPSNLAILTQIIYFHYEID